MKLFDLTGKTALVTGGSQGIGLALALGLEEAGAAIVLNGRDPARLADAAARFARPPRLLPFDVTDHGAARAAVDGYEAQTGPIDILVNNAGIQHRAPMDSFPPEEFERLMATNVGGLFNVGQAVARHMIGRGAGKIVNIASVQAALARPGVGVYAATKGAVANLTKGMATDWARHGLQCNALAPGYFDTPLNAALVKDAAFSEWIERRVPAGRWGRLDELVGAAVFLASPASSYVNGAILYVDGGMTASL